MTSALLIAVGFVVAGAVLPPAWILAGLDAPATPARTKAR